MQPANRYILALEENRAIFIDDIVPALFSHVAHLKTPELHIIGGQPGSGKSTLINEVADDLKKRFNNESVVSIIGDDFRPFHPHYKKLLEIDASKAAYYTDTDSGRWVEQAVDLTAQQGNCVVIEGTLHDPEVNLRTASRYIQHGFTAHLHVLAVHEFLSRFRIFQRYFDENDNSSHGRYTLLDAHDRSYRVLPESVATLIDSSLFKTVTLYDQDQNPIKSFNLPEKEARQNVLAVLEERRNNKHINTAEILLAIDGLLPPAKKHGKIYTDLQELHKTLLHCGQISPSSR